ncbi:MAG TPA: hypothetical protein VGG39_02165 [Polyangiaceae bacterium]
MEKRRGPRWRLKLETFVAVQRIAKDHGGRCLTRAYVNLSTEMRWRCAEGHEWMAGACDVTPRRWCPTCKRERHGAIFLGRLRGMAAARGGRCLSTRYGGSAVRLRWECVEGHRWWAKPNGITKGDWCERCHGLPLGDIERMRGIARRRGGQCLSTEYRGVREHLLWRCREGHEWRARPNVIINGRWCPGCKRGGGKPEPLGLEEMQRMALARGGRCLSTRYANSLTPMRWECARGHRWSTRPSDIRSLGAWCPRCATRFRGTLGGMQAWARSLGGRCLTTEHDDRRIPVRWQCAKGHRFEQLVSVVRTGVWCPKCPRVL